MDRSWVVTGGGRGVGRAIAERLLADGGIVVVVDRDDAALGWASAHPAGARVIPLAGDAADEAVTGQAADLAQAAGRLTGWVNNAARGRGAGAGPDAGLAPARPGRASRRGRGRRQLPAFAGGQLHQRRHPARRRRAVRPRP